MKLLVVGDFNYGATDTMEMVKGYLDYIHDIDPISQLVTFDTDGVNYLSTVWAYDRKVPFVCYKGSVRDISMNNAAFKAVVKDFAIENFLFIFLDNKKDISSYKWNVRWMFRRAVKAFKGRNVYTNIGAKQIKKLT